MYVCLLMPCGHLLGKGWPLGYRLWCLIVTLSLSHWYPGSGVVLDCIYSWFLPSFLLSLASVPKLTSSVSSKWTPSKRGVGLYGIFSPLASTSTRGLAIWATSLSRGKNTDFSLLSTDFHPPFCGPTENFMTSCFNNCITWIISLPFLQMVSSSANLTLSLPISFFWKKAVKGYIIKTLIALWISTQQV